MDISNNETLRKRKKEKLKIVRKRNTVESNTVSNITTSSSLTDTISSTPSTTSTTFSSSHIKSTGIRDDDSTVQAQNDNLVHNWKGNALQLEATTNNFELSNTNTSTGTPTFITTSIIDSSHITSSSNTTFTSSGHGLSDLFDIHNENNIDDSPVTKSSTEREWAGIRVSFSLLNAKFMTSSPSKAIELSVLLENKKWPNIVVITEVGGYAGNVNLYDFFSSTIIGKKYDLFWTVRSISKHGKAPDPTKLNGGGVALLVAKKLCVTVSEFKFNVSNDDRKFLDGHLRVWRLDPMETKLAKQNLSALHRTVIVTAAYIPPLQSEWGKLVRQPVFNGICSADLTIRELRRSQNVFSVTMAHTNSHDGGCDVPIVLDSGCKDFEKIRMRMESLPNFKRTRGTLQFQTQQDLTLKRCQSKHSKKTTIDGINMIANAAKVGKVPLCGVMGHRQSTSWTVCRICPVNQACSCKRKKYGVMHNVHDQVWLPSDSVVDALLSPTGGNHLIQYRTERIMWSSIIDHAVTYGFFFVPPAPDALNIFDNLPVTPLRLGVVRKQSKRLRLPSDIFSRFNVLSEIAAETQRTIVSTTTSNSTSTTTNRSSSDQPEMADGDITGSTDTTTSGTTSNTLCELNASFTGCLQTACDSIISKQQCGDLAATTSRSTTNRIIAPSLFISKLSLKKAWRNLNRVLKKIKMASQYGSITSSSSTHTSKNRTPSQNARVIEANKRVKRAQSEFARLSRVEMSYIISNASVRAPLLAWSLLKSGSMDKGAPKTPTCKLLERINDENGGLLSTNKETIINHLLHHRKTVFQYPSLEKLGEVCEQGLNEALSELHFANKSILSQVTTISNDSAVYHSAQNPLHPLLEIDKRRQIRRNLEETLIRYSEIRPNSTANQFRHTNSIHYSILEGDIQLDEVLQTLKSIKDVGAGTDGINPIFVKFLDDQPATKILKIFQLVWNSGIIPESWKEHRCILHYKGKGSDPYSVENYRGLGIDQLLLKILSLIMMNRLEIFLHSTNGLSALQGGFLSNRGPPEQIFTLSETVRSAIRQYNDAPVHLVFIDIKRAYDSVLHPILWQKCIRKGISGRFLATLQAIYFGSVAILDVNGELLSPVPIECGVLQGNPLSPLLFNIYIDSAITDLCEAGNQSRSGPFGIPLPSQYASNLQANVTSNSQTNYLPSLFFADDGVLISKCLKQMKLMLETVNRSLTNIGLELNITKTHWLIVAPSHSSNEDYEKIKSVCLDPSKSHLPSVNSTAIKNVDKFEYLGATIWWRWDWTEAWHSAQSRAKWQLYCARQGGFQYTGSLNSQLKYANGVIFCHFNYISAIAGSGGNKTSAPWNINENIVSDTLQTITNSPFTTGQALKIEAGVWDQRTRIDKLVLRFFAKICASEKNSTHYRAMLLSFKSLTATQISHPSSSDSSCNHLHRQPWSQSVLAAALRFGLPKEAILVARPGLLIVQTLDNGVYVNLPHPDDELDLNVWSINFVNHCYLQKLRLILVGLQYHSESDYVEGESCWYLPIGTDYKTVFNKWTIPLRNASYEALQRLGNRHRQVDVHEYLKKQIDTKSSLRRWAAIISSSFEQPYWRISDASQARRLLHLRFDSCPNEGNCRRRPMKQTNNQRTLPRLVEHLRACYLCDCIDDKAVGIYWPETVEHTLLYCSGLEEERRAIRNRLSEIINNSISMSLSSNASVPVPNVYDDTTLMTILQLCVCVGPTAILQPLPIASENNTDPEIRIHGTRGNSALTEEIAIQHARRLRSMPKLVYNSQVARDTARWVHTLTNDWCQYLRNPRSIILETHPGQLLAECVASHAQRVFSKRRKLLQNRDDFNHRNRDPQVVVVTEVTL
jgi:hypothetical protein